MDSISIISMFSFFAILILLVVIREKTNNRFEVKSTEVVLALTVPAVILFASGKISSFQFGDLKIESAFKKAATSQVDKQISKLSSGVPIEVANSSAKGSVSQIPSMINSNIEVLTFKLGHGGYYGRAIHKFMKELTTTPSFKYIVINDTDGTFWCMANAKEIASSNVMSYFQLADYINSAEKEPLKKLPGFISIKDAVANVSNKSNVLLKMEEKDIDQLPAIDENKMFIGMVSRSRILTSLILDVTTEL